MFTKPPRNKTLAICLTLTFVVIAAMLCSVPSYAKGAKDKPIITTLQSEGDFTTFLKAINDAGLAKTLHGHGPYTVFAPTDAAFAKLPADQRNNLLTDKTKLKRFVAFHVIHTKLTTADLNGRKGTPNTLEGDPLQVASAAGVVTVNGAAIVKPDVAASNGTIEEIDTVLMPPSVISLGPGPTRPAPRAPAAPVNPPPSNSPPPPNPPASPPVALPSPVNPPASPPAPYNPTSPTNLPMQPANPPGTPGNPPGAPGTPLPEQPAPAPANPPGDPGTPAPAPAMPGTPPGSTAPTTPVNPPANTSPPANNTPAQ